MRNWTILNEQLLQEPNLTSTLVGVITRFTQEEVAVMADIEAMFHQVKVSIVSSVYDPLGILAPVVLMAKRILQELCREKLDWDTLIPDRFADEWSKWKTSLRLLEGVSVPRCFKPAGFGKAVVHQLHHGGSLGEDDQIQERHKCQRPSRNFVIGDIVLIVDDSASRNVWVMGKIVQTVPDKYRMVRQVRIKTKTRMLDRNHHEDSPPPGGRIDSNTQC
ncbi:hypothetical protein F2P81_016119 [Scophthalmus maximus]|uniref:DUF5641 domain-containing protein n=1 Tax=Scophthalmus maximus TaxID=52904 RepID=A0A6A4SKM4_SCOMX|nr:hypothetical protein F2P81_016119 [Scophthalmus maximus]